MEREYPCYCWVKPYTLSKFVIGLVWDDDAVFLSGDDTAYPADCFEAIGDVIEMPEKYRRHD